MKETAQIVNQNLDCQEERDITGKAVFSLARIFRAKTSRAPLR